MYSGVFPSARYRSTAPQFENVAYQSLYRAKPAGQAGRGRRAPILCFFLAGTYAYVYIDEVDGGRHASRWRMAADEAVARADAISAMRGAAARARPSPRERGSVAPSSEQQIC